MKNRIKRKNIAFRIKPNCIKLFILSVIVFAFSCKKETIEPDGIVLPVTYNFLKFEFDGGIDCYTSDLNRFEYLGTDFNSNDFVFTDRHLSYNKIEIEQDSTVKLYVKNLSFSIDAILKLSGDAVSFHMPDSADKQIFKGYIRGNQLRVPAYGYKYQDSDLFGTHWHEYAHYGEPNMDILLEPMLWYSYDKLLIQKFEVVYDKNIHYLLSS